MQAGGPSPNEEEHISLEKYQKQWNTRWDPELKQFDLRDFAALDATRDALQRRLLDIRERGTLRGKAIEWLGRTTFPAPRRARPHARYGEHFAERYRHAYMAAHFADSRVLGDLQGMAAAEIKRVNREAGQKIGQFLKAPHRRAIIFLLQFSSQPLLAWPASLVEALLELDQAFANWRDRHIAMVARVLGGGRISTLGAADSGLPYLRGTLSKRVFPEIWIGHAGGWPLVVAAGVLVAWAQRTMAGAGETSNVYKPNGAIVSNGPFAFTRNPMYLSMTLLYTGIAFVVNTAWPFVLLPAALMLIQYGVIHREERYLESKLGPEYRQYRANVRRWL